MKDNEYETIFILKEDGIATVTLNRPDVLNAMSPKLMDELSQAIESVVKDKDVKVVVITGAGKAFCAGGDVNADVSQVSKMTAFEWREYDHNFCNVIRQIYWMEKPVIAAVNGIAGGGGLDLALACDIRVVSEKARFASFYVRMGIIPDLGGNYFLPRFVGLGRAKLLAFSGDIIDARQADRLGLVDMLVPASEFTSSVKALAQKIAQGPTKAIAMTKIAMNRSLHMDLETSLDYSSTLQVLLFSTEDHKEGYQAFLEKREAQFKGK